jgi:hypothetical protein
MTNPLTDIELAAAELQTAEAAVLDARRKHETALRRQPPPKHVRDMTREELHAAARRLGISGPL